MCSRFRDFFVCCGCLLLASCNQSQEQPSGMAPAGTLVRGNQQSTLQPAQPAPMRPVANPLPATEQIKGEGKQLYNQFNCSGCHAGGGGAIGPSLMDDEWIYGSSAGNIFWTIMEGRPQGMPAFGGKVPEHQVWRIVAYVRSLSDLPEKDAASPDDSQQRPLPGKQQ